MKSKNHVKLCLGIDPNPAYVYSFDAFKEALSHHTQFLDLLIKDKTFSESSKVIKFQLSFFLAHGSKGIALLEKTCHKYKDHFFLIIDGKFNDIANSMQAYLDFVFITLEAHGITINPFLGEKTIENAYDSCAKHRGGLGRVYVLCATSETPSSFLADIQSNWQNKLKACAQIRNNLFKDDKEYQSLAGVVIGANHEHILTSHELSQARLSVLSPGLGSQGADWGVIKKCASLKNEFLFNVGRGIFEAGQAPVSKIEKNFLEVQKYFKWN